MNNPLLARFDGKPFLVSADMQSVFESCLHQSAIHLERIEASGDAPKMMEGNDFWFADDDWRAKYRPYTVKDGILQIPVKGVLMHNFGYQFGSNGTGYDYIWAAFQRGMADSNVKAIALVCDTPGGEVAGNFDLVDRMYAMKGAKPIRGYATESAYSAGYSIISVADSITVSRTGGVGSIGVITAHVDMSAAVEARGMKVTFIHFGAHKKDGNPYEALSAEVKARMQARIDELGEVFVATVARNRGMTEQAVRDTEALTFTATQAVSIGLADEIGSFDDAIAAFAADLSLNDEDEKMTEEEKRAAAQAALNSARAEGVAEGTQAGALAERERITAITTGPEGAKRPVAAMAAAMDTDMTAEQASKFLAKLPEEKAVAIDPNAPKTTGDAAADFITAMNNAQHPNAGNMTAMTEAQQAEAARRQRSLNAAAASGRLKVVDLK